MCLKLEAKKIISNTLFKIMICSLVLVAILDPVSSYYISKVQNDYTQAIGTNAFQMWLLMNFTGWGHAFYFSLFFVFPIVSTGFVFFYERSSSIYGITLSKVPRKKYFLNKIVSVFVVSFLCFLIILVMNLIITYKIFDTKEITGQYYYSVPQIGSFAKIFYDKNPFIMGVMYCVLNALFQGMMSMLTFAIHMIGKFKKIYTAFLIPFIVLYAMEFLFTLLTEYFNKYVYNPILIVQPKAANVLYEPITGINVFVTILVLLIMIILLYFIGMKRNEDVI